MDKNQSYLRWLIHEDIYVVNEADNRLYRDKVKLTEDPAPMAASPKEAILPAFKGENRARILILIDYAHSPYLPAEQEEFLLQILQAIDLEFDDIALANVHKKDLVEILDIIDHRIALIFMDDLNREDLPELIHYNMIEIQDRKYLPCHNLETIKTDKSKKVMLWEQLKSLFGK